MTVGPFSYEKAYEREECLTQIREDTEKKSTDEKRRIRATLMEDSVDYPQHSAY